MKDNDALIESARSVPIEDVLIRHGIKLRRVGQERVGPCPSCGGTDRFAINVAKGIFNCRGCGASGDVIELVEFLDKVDFKTAIETLTGEDFKNGHREPHAGKSKLGKIDKIYSYEDENGVELYQVVRFDPKDFRQRRADGAGGWIWNLNNVRLVPYRLPELIEALASDRTVFIVEGEKDVDNVLRLGAPATCNPRGAGKWGACNIDDHFRDGNVIIIADNDPQATNKKTGALLTHDDGRPRFAGWDHAIEVAQHLNEIAASVRIIDLKKIWPFCPDKGDISNWIAAGGTIEALYEIAEQTPLWDGDVVREADNRTLVQSSAEFIRDFIPPDYLIDGILQKRFLYSNTGKTGSGKTAIVLFIAACVALGRKIGDIEVEQGRVLYFAGENPDDVRMRWIAMAQQMDFDATTINVCFIPGRFEISKMRERILAEIQQIGEVALIIIDTSAAYYEGKEVNSNTEQAEHARRLRTLIAFPGGPCVLVNCHPVKNASVDNLLPLGAGSFLNEVDGNLTCIVDYPAIEVHWQGKFRGADFEPLNFRLHNVTHERLKNTKGKLIPTVIAKHLGEAEKEAIEQANRSDEQRLLIAINANGKLSYAEYAVASGFFIAGDRAKPNKDKARNLIRRKLIKKDKWVAGEHKDYVLTPLGKSKIKDLETVSVVTSEPTTTQVDMKFDTV